jgi:hypothetical protein
MAKKASEGRPARGKKRRKSGGQRGLFLGLIVLALVLAGGAAVWIVSLRKGDRDRAGAENGPKPKILRYLPDKPIGFSTTRAAALLANPHYQKLREKSKAPFEWQPSYNQIPKEKVERFTSCSGQGSVAILFLTEPITAADIRQKNTSTAIANSWSEEKIGKQTLHVHTSAFQIHVEGGSGTGGSDPTCFFMPDDRTVVIGTADALRPILVRDGKPQLTPEFESAFAALDLEKPIVALEDRSASDSGVTAYADKPCVIDFRVDLDRRVSATKTIQADIGPEVVVVTTFGCKEPADAQYLKAKIEAGRERQLKALGADARDLFKNQTLALDGATLTVKTGQSVSAILAWLDKRNGSVIGR